MRLAWWRGAIAGERQDEAAGSPVALALSAAIDAYALPAARLEAMLDARLQEIAPQDDFNLAAFRAFADESEGARLRLAALIAAGGVELDEADAHAPAGMALALTRLIGELPFKAGSAPTLIPADVAARHGASGSDFDARRASAGVIAACAELRGLARDELAEAERRLNGSSPRDPAGLHSARALAARSRSARPQRRAPVRAARRGLAAPSAMGDLALGAGDVAAVRPKTGRPQELPTERGLSLCRRAPHQRAHNERMNEPHRRHVKPADRIVDAHGG